MPISPISFPILNAEQANPIGYGFNQMSNALQALSTKKAQDFETQAKRAELPEELLKMHLANVIERAKSQYAPQQALADLRSTQAQGGLYGSQSAEINYKLKHPELMDPADVQTLKYIMSLGGRSGSNMPSVSSSGSAYPTSPASAPNINNSTQINQDDRNQNQLSATGAPRLIEGTNIPSTGNPLADAFVANKYMTPGDKDNLMLKKQQELLEFKDQQKENENEAADSKNLINLLNELDSFHSAYKKSSRVGSARGTMPSSGPTTVFGNFSNEQDADQSSNVLQGIVAKGLSGRMTNMIFQAARGMKVDRSLERQSEENIYNKLRAQTLRGLQLQNFRSMASNLQIPWKDQNTLWAHYQVDKPAFDPKTSKILDSNLTDQSIEKFLLSKKLKQINSSENNSKPVVMKQVSIPPSPKYPNGATITLPEDQANKLISDHPDHKIIG